MVPCSSSLYIIYIYILGYHSSVCVPLSADPSDPSAAAAGSSSPLSDDGSAGLSLSLVGCVFVEGRSAAAAASGSAAVADSSSAAAAAASSDSDWSVVFFKVGFFSDEFCSKVSFSVYYLFNSKSI